MEYFLFVLIGFVLIGLGIIVYLEYKNPSKFSYDTNCDFVGE